MNTMTLTRIDMDIKEPTFKVWARTHPKDKMTIYWQGNSLILAVIKMISAKNRGWWYVKLEWME